MAPPSTSQATGVDRVGAQSGDGGTR